MKASTGYVIQSVTYEASSTGNYVTYAKEAGATPQVTPTVSGKNVTWSFGDNSEVTEFTFRPASQTRCNSITITYKSTGGTTPVDSRTDVVLSFPNNSYTATMGTTFTAPTLTVDPAAAASDVNYNSSKTSVATVGDDGSITLISAGTTTITASITNSETYKDAIASYTLTVDPKPLAINPKNVNSNYFVKITDVASLEDGDAILIVNEEASKAMGTTQNTNNRSGADVTIAGNSINIPDENVQKIILVKEGNYFYFYTGDDNEGKNLFLYAASGSANQLKTAAITTAGDNAKATITFKDGNATIFFQGTNTRNIIKYNNAQNNGNLFSCYASSSTMKDVQIYKEVPAVAKIGNTSYASLKEAVDAANANDVITLIADDKVSLTTVGSEVTISKPLTITGEVDENGKPKYTIFGNANGALNNNSFNDLFLSCNTGTVTVSNVKFDGFGNEISSVMGHSPLFIGSKNNNAVIENVYFSNLNCEGIHINGGTFTINNCNIDCSKTTNSIFTKGICVVNEAQGSITNTTITGVDCDDANDTSAAIELQGSGNIIINGCTIQTNTIGIATTPVQDLTAGTSQVTVSNCTIESPNIAVYSNGEKGASTSILSGFYSGLLMAGDNDEGLSISGGYFDDTIEPSYCANGFIPSENTDEATKVQYPYTVKEGSYVAEVGGVKYESFTEAVAALTEDNNTITLLAAVEDAYTLAEGQTLNVILGENTLTVLAPEGYLLKTSVADGVTTYSYAAPVAKIGDTMYASLVEAVAAVPAGEETTITMIADETIVGNAGVMIPVGKNIVLDLNGKTITLNIAEAKASQLITNRGTLTITDSSEEQTGKLTNAADESLPVGTWPELNFATNIITNSGTLNVQGGTIQNNAKGSICYAVDNNNTSYDAILNIQGGYLTSVGTVIRQFCNSTTKQNVLNISGGTVETNGYAALWTQLPGSTGQKKLATLNITGGVIKGSSYAWYDYSDGDSFDAVNYSITGGELYGYLYSYAVANGVKPGFVTGGLFSKDVSNCCAEGLACVVSEENPGMYEIGPAEVYYSWEQNGTMVGEYCTFAAPFVNGWLCDGEFITLQKNITLTEDIVCQLAEGSFTLTQGEFSIAKGDYSVSLLPNVSVLTNKQTDIFSAAEAGYVIEETEVDGGYKYTAVEVTLAAPIIFHDGGEYEGARKVAMAGQGTIKYTLNGGAEQTYSAPINVSETTTITAWTESNGVKSDEVSKTFTIAAATAGPAVEDNYYTIKNNGNNKYVNIAGRKTVTFVDETATAAGTVIRVKANDKGQVQILRSQGVDIPGYAEKAMNYVPKIVELIVDKLHAEGSGELLGENGLDAIMAKFKESFDYHLYLEEANGGYRIYGRTPSMQPVVDFYAENKANVDAKLPGLEAFINSAIEKVLQKTNGSGASILVPFSLQTVWEKMGSTLTKPEDEASTAKFYEEVLSSEANVWNFAYETAMIYWTKLKDHDKFKENLNKLGDYAKYIDKVENIRPNFKYYIVQKDNQLDFISQGNSELNAAFTTWTLAERTDFSVAFPEDNLLNGKYYTTLYTDFAYTLPEGVKAYKVTKVSKAGVAVKKELTTVPAQTPVLLEAESAESQTLTLSTEEGTAPTDNLLKGADFLINEYTIKTAQIESLFDLAKEMLGESAYETYMKEYEHLMLRNSGTVNNKYFFGLDQTDLKSVENVRMLNLNDAGEKLGFYSNWTELEANRAFIVDSNDPVKLFLRGDVNRDGEVDINDATATVDIVLGKATLETHSDVYDFEAADANENGAITIDDVVTIVNMVLGKQ